MKKLMIAAAIVCATALSQAATVQWKSGSLYVAANNGGGWTTGSSNMMAMKQYTAYSAVFYLADAEAYAAAQGKTQAELWNTYGNSDITKIGYDSEGAKIADAIGSGMGTTNAKDTDGVYKTYYAVVIETYHDTALGKDFYIATTATQTTSTSGEGQLGNIISNYAAATGSTGWQPLASPVPEPTSGLLLLLGVAGMALRRRRA